MRDSSCDSPGKTGRTKTSLKSVKGFLWLLKVLHLLIVLRDPFLAFFPLSFSVFYRFPCMLKVLKVEKVKVHATGSSSLPRQTLLLKYLKNLVSSLAFNFLTSRYVTMLHIYDYIRGRSEAYRKLTTQQS